MPPASATCASAHQCQRAYRRTVPDGPSAGHSAPTGNRAPPGGVRGTVDRGGPSTIEDSELIERARNGDVAAYEDLVRRYQDLALRTAHVVCPEADADDAVQDAFLKAYAALPRFRAGSPFRPWVLRIVANEARNRRRSASRRDGLALRAAAADPRLGGVASFPAPDAQVLAAETSAELVTALRSLSDDDREVLGARFLLDLSEAETAETLGLPRGTVKSRTSRALGRLRLALGSLDRGLR